MHTVPRSALAVVIAVAVVSACTGHAGRPVAQSSTVASSPRATAPSGAARFLIGPLSIQLPHGWKADANADFSHACLEPSGVKEQAFGCAGLDAYYDWGGQFLPGNEASDFRDSPGWYHGTGVSPCPVDPTKGPSGLNAMRGNDLVRHGLAPVGDRRADYYEWAASCDSGYRWHPRAWYLPISKVLVFDYIETPQSAAILRGATFESGRWTMGYLHAMNGAAGGRTVDVDEFTWLSGAAANRYAKAHGMQSPVPDDYLIVDDDESTVPTRLLEQATIVSEFALAGTEPGHPKQVSVEHLAGFLATPTHWSTPFHLHLDATGAIDEIVEQYVP
jgi:hypothetical protein